MGLFTSFVPSQGKGSNTLQDSPAKFLKAIFSVAQSTLKINTNVLEIPPKYRPGKAYSEKKESFSAGRELAVCWNKSVARSHYFQTYKNSKQLNILRVNVMPKNTFKPKSVSKQTQLILVRILFRASEARKSHNARVLGRPGAGWHWTGTHREGAVLNLVRRKLEFTYLWRV